ncbi:Asp23/Gls24 family envelope stress response protein [Oceanirhabdus sp. W0125-5]|uniref:Asp23/Gls24 family envelope stress response protein n=1 Tax=Oceanirhabdus sp. W0125-5 TaxID=2999116 RepID=UPI0022F2C29C|nr:Asp23/Gls24 family envelope stress response protein [Oceanirhabdus sp. W0125-5]WBW95327.1 Asp23/Gls24 family envelope stress response protein [Oceanirhabdus sp. W0125-5]
MEEKKSLEKIEEMEKGTVKISDDVIGVIANLAINDVNGIVGITSGIVEGFTNMFSKKNLHKGIKISFEENKASIDLNIVVEYGVKIQDVCHEAQKAVKTQVETMTGIDVEAVNIYVHDVVIPKKTETILEEETITE